MKSRFDLSEKRQALLDSLLKDQSQGQAGGPPQRPWWADPDDARQKPPLSFAQERFWFLDRLQPGNPVYHVPSMIPLHGALDLGALRQSLADLVSRHAALRTTFDVEDGSPVQVVAPGISVPLPVVACEGSTKEERRAHLQQMAQAEVIRPFDLQKGPLLRAVLFRVDPDEHWLVVTVHHIVYDAWSNGIFFRELASFYEANRLGRAANLPELPLQYADFARWQRRWLEGETLQKLYAYWKEKLAGAPSVLELPLDRPRPAFSSLRGGLCAFTLPAEPSDKLRELGREEQTTLFMTLLAAFKVLLYRYTGQRDLVVGTPMTSRSRSELEGLIGLFLNTLVLRTRLSGASTFRELLRQVRADTLEAYEHQDLPFEKLVEELQPDRNLNVNPLFQVFFVLQTHRQGGASADEEILAQPSTGSSKFDLSLYLADAGREISGIWEYSSDLFEEATIARMAGHFRTLASAIARDPDARISDLPLLTDEERRQLSAWNQTRAEYPAELCAHQLFESQARATPDAPALVFQGRELTYPALNARSNQIAHRLQSLGVGPDVAVGICVERSIDMVAGLLGVLKAGGAYLPLDPAYPRERIAYMLRNGRARVLLTQEHLAPSLPGDDGGAVILLDTDASLAAEPETDPASGARPENL
ncbi:MAG: condensation domain-containing protein, partial [Thermoanaerobaculia bacterium]